MTIGERLLEEINGGSCDLLVGSWMGQYTLAKSIIIGIFLYAILKSVEKLAYDPFLDWCKKKIYKIKKISKR